MKVSSVAEGAIDEVGKRYGIAIHSDSSPNFASLLPTTNVICIDLLSAPPQKKKCKRKADHLRKGVGLLCTTAPKIRNSNPILPTLNLHQITTI